MPQRPSLARFIAAPLSHKLMAIEAMFELALARANTLGSARHFTKAMGQLEGRPVSATSDQQTSAATIGHMVELTSRWMPFRCVCLQQVLAVRRMMRRRHLPGTVYLGVLPDDMAKSADFTMSPGANPPPAAAHAWVKSGDRVVNGNTPDLNTYVVLGVFS